MLRFMARRFMLAVPSLFGLLVLTFFLIRVVPATRPRRARVKTPRRNRLRRFAISTVSTGRFTSSLSSI